MIATGGLLRISARRQDSLRSKNRAENKRKRKAKKKRKNDVVVVKGKLKLCSISGLVAAVGILVLLVGISMAVLGYWPKDSPVYQNLQASKPKPMRTRDKTLSVSTNWTSNSQGANHVDEHLISINYTNGTTPTDTPPTLGFFAEFLARYMYSDRLKVFGPLIMGIGIFLFICANAVLHENRDKKTKIINLRDIYSTVIDIHSLRTKDCTPLNGFVNYVQSRSIEGKPSSAYSAAMLAKTSWPSTLPGKLQEQGVGNQSKRQSFAKQRSLSRERQTFTETVYSIYREQNRTVDQVPIPKQWETRSIVTSSINAFTLPMIKLNSCALDEGNRLGKAEREKDSKDKATLCEPEQALAGRGVAHAETSQSSRLAPQDSVDVYKSTGSLQGVPRASLQGSQVQLLPSSPGRRLTGSHLSLSALSDYSRSVDLGICPSPAAEWQVERPRRLSCPRLDCANSKGYIKLGDLGGESFESSEVVASRQEVSEEALARRLRQAVAPDQKGGNAYELQREITKQYSNKEKLLMIAKSDITLDDDEVESTGI
ncbi:transmembrane protein 200C [Megalops cyprinoides]|uniref:transmembrane protein 200C n=1 Tax=Megalops cyprinoides TaxID=118141 RepID=UPI00186466DE|nr:transmembrane protein 200C [Megalops cyprinoides]